jgi:hypothetical protein
MDAKELLLWQLDYVGGQLEKAVEGLSDPAWGHKAWPGAMSPQEILLHVCDSHRAYLSASAGEKYEFGSFTLEDPSPPALIAALREARERSKARILETDDLKMATEYTLAHDAYHVGQLCAARLDIEPEWDPYSIY